METSVHRQLKEYFCSPGSQQEVKIGRYRIDVVDGERLIEIQHSSLSAIRDKIANLLKSHQVDVIKPIVVRKKLINLNRRNGKVVSQRLSPRRGGFVDLFDELLYFTRVFPNPSLRLITPWIEVEEIRYPGHGRRRRKRAGDFVVMDRLLTEIVDVQTYQTAGDLQRHLPEMDNTFDTQQIAGRLGIKRHHAQRMAYVMKHTGCIEQVGKQGNANIYRLSKPKPAARKRAAATRKPETIELRKCG